MEEIPSSVRLRGFFEVLRVNFYDLKKIHRYKKLFIRY